MSVSGQPGAQSPSRRSSTSEAIRRNNWDGASNTRDHPGRPDHDSTVRPEPRQLPVGSGLTRNGRDPYKETCELDESERGLGF